MKITVTMDVVTNMEESLMRDALAMVLQDEFGGYYDGEGVDVWVGEIKIEVER